MRKHRHCFIVGAQRSGTTYLYRILDSHPEIYMAKPLRPEPKFFLNQDKYEKGYSYYLAEYFPESMNAAELLGEKSTSYIESSEAASRIQNWFPNAKLLIILWNPVQRALSNYYFSVEHGLETRTPEEVFIEQVSAPQIPVEISVSPFDYLKRGNYLPYIKLYRQLFSKEQINILIFEKVVGNIQPIQNLYQWLGVSPDHVSPFLLNKINPSEQKQSIGRQIYDFLYSYFHDQVAELEDCLNISLSEWKK